MTTETRPWLTVGATVAVISTGRTTCNMQISMDTVESIDDKVVTTLGHQFNLDTLEADVHRYHMYFWRIADPESLQVKHDLAVQVREKTLTAVLKDQARFEQDPTDLSALSLLMQGLNRYRDTVIEVERAAQALKDAS